MFSTALGDTNTAAIFFHQICWVLYYILLNWLDIFWCNSLPRWNFSRFSKKKSWSFKAPKYSFFILSLQCDIVWMFSSNVNKNISVETINWQADESSKNVFLKATNWMSETLDDVVAQHEKLIEWRWNKRVAIDVWWLHFYGKFFILRTETKRKHRYKNIWTGKNQRLTTRN